MYLSSWASNMGPPGCEVFSKGSLITWKKEYTAASGVQMDGQKGKTKKNQTNTNSQSGGVKTQSLCRDTGTRYLVAEQ